MTIAGLMLWHSVSHHLFHPFHLIKSSESVTEFILLKINKIELKKTVSNYKKTTKNNSFLFGINVQYYLKNLT